MDVVKVTEGYYTVRLDKVEQSNIATLAQAWDVKGECVFTWLLVRAIEDAVTGPKGHSKRRKGGKHADKG